MSLKKWLQNKDAVSPVISTTLMVAITVTLAALVASNAFSQEHVKSAPRTNIDIKAAGINGSVASVKLENLGGGQINFKSSTETMVLASLNEGEYVNIPAVGLGVLDIGFVKTLKLAADGDGTEGTVNAFAATPVHGDTVNIKIIDVNANEVISNKDVMF